MLDNHDRLLYIGADYSDDRTFFCLQATHQRADTTVVGLAEPSAAEKDRLLSSGWQTFDTVVDQKLAVMEQKLQVAAAPGVGNELVAGDFAHASAVTT